GAREGLEDGLDPPPRGAKPVRHLCAPGHRPIRPAARVEGDVEKHGHRGQGAVLAKEAEGGLHRMDLRCRDVQFQALLQPGERRF
ncbi:hypothetical protein P8629_12305, partial [Hydrogenovibrio sp. 3SP14C1]|nr:hypothetical protein [Hydrogenovibrio sp. 3SP14C1]